MGVVWMWTFRAASFPLRTLETCLPALQCFSYPLPFHIAVALQPPISHLHRYSRLLIFLSSLSLLFCPLSQRPNQTIIRIVFEPPEILLVFLQN